MIGLMARLVCWKRFRYDSMCETCRSTCVLLVLVLVLVLLLLTTTVALLLQPPPPPPHGAIMAQYNIRMGRSSHRCVTLSSSSSSTFTTQTDSAVPIFSTNVHRLPNHSRRIPQPHHGRTWSTRLYATSSPDNDNDDNDKSNNNKQNTVDKFGWQQRWASVQSFVGGAIVGSVASAPISFLHNFVVLSQIHNHPLAQWEYDTDSNAVMGGLFAIVYRYCLRDDGDTNPQLKQGCVNAMILIRTLPQIQIPAYCTPLPLNCHHDNVLSRILFPMSYILDDANVLQQLFWTGLESTLLFTVTAQMMDMAMNQTYIVRFPG
jgi:hypothetical protein